MLSNEMNFQKGPIFTNIVLADELNREAKVTKCFFDMEEKVSIDGESYNLPESFLLLQPNPMDSSGTSSLPESQLDRFMISFSLSELSEEEKF